ncbi:SusC/RagA family TonB-linked outer membrane protein [Bacteroidota bacterium]
MKRGILVFLMIFTCLPSLWAQDRLVSGKVTADEDGSALPGVNVMIMGTTEGVITDMDGNYKVSVPDGATLGFSYIGFAGQEIAVGNRSVIDVSMLTDATELQEVVVTALGITRDKMALSSSVTEVEGDQFTEARELNIANALAGHVAGVNVSNMGTGPAGSTRVIIRGNASISGGNQPLYVIDGIPMDNSDQGQAGMWGGNDWGDGTSSINPDDIESISVLKGANAAALYGSRASNGVILITTKKGGKKKGLGVEFNSNYVFETVYDQTEYQTEYGHGGNGEPPENASSVGLSAWGGPLDGSIPLAWGRDSVMRPYVNTFEEEGQNGITGNNFKKFYEPGTTFTNSLAVSGGDAKQNFRASLSYLDNNSPMQNAGFDRLNASLNANGQYGKFTLGAKILYSNEKAKNRPRVSDSPGNPHQAIFNMPSSMDITDYQGDPDKPGATYTKPDGSRVVITGSNHEDGEELNVFGTWLQNPYWAAYQYVGTTDRDRVIGSFLGRYDITDWLFVHLRAGTDWNMHRRESLEPYGTAYRRGGGGNTRNRTTRETNMEWLLGVNKTFGEIGLNAFVGGNWMRRKYEEIGISYSDFNIPFYHSPSNGNSQSFFYGFNEKGINSLFGSVELNYGGFIYLTATAREDWFSTLNPETNNILYPSVGVSYVFSDMFTMPSFVTAAKVRGSWAQVGGDTDPYATLLTYGLEGAGHLSRPLGRISQSSIPNANLKPLTSSEYEFGFDVRFFENRLGLDFTYYRQLTTDDILSATISVGSGFTGTTVNIGEMENKGIEFLLTATPVRGDLTWDVSFNIANNISEVLALGSGIEKLGGTEPRTRQAYIYHVVGKPYSSIWGYTHNSIGGEKMYRDNSEPIFTDTISLIGQGVHPVTGGINNSFTYKNFVLSFLIDFKLGGDIYSGTNTRLTQWGFHEMTLEGRDGTKQISGVTAEGAPLSMTIATDQIDNYWNQYANCSENMMYDASFWKFRQVTLGYNFPASILDKTPFSYLNLSFVGRNLWVISKHLDNIDPEMMYNSNNYQGLDYFAMPQTRSYGFNLRVRF